jgi:hypothetical protein
MRAVIVYESMYGNTHLVADAIGKGLGAAEDVAVVPIGQATRELLESADVVVVGGPTHVHGMSRPSTRKSATDAAERPGTGLQLDANSHGPGVRDWLASLGQVNAKAAAFDTRFPGPAFLTGRASKGIARGLRRHGFDLIAEPESFIVNKDNHLRLGESDRAVAWAEGLAAKMAITGSPTHRPESAPQ